MNKVFAAFLCVAGCAHAPSSGGADLSAPGVVTQVYGRTPRPLVDGERRGLGFNEDKDVGVGWLAQTLEAGTIEADLRGKDVLQKSFIGLLFAGTDEAHNEVIYLRPFNFKSPDADRRGHSIQYVAHPDHGWKQLRADSPGRYEGALDPAPDPNGWFHLKVTFDKETVVAEVDGKKALEVKRLQTGGNRVAIWVGDASGGEFANLSIR